MILETPGFTHTNKAPPFKGYWTSSQLGCWRRMILLAKEIEGDFYESPVLAEGRLHEDDIIAKLQVKGVTVTDRQLELRHPVLPLRGHPDGKATIMGSEGLNIPAGRYLLEAKSMDRAIYAKAVKDFRAFFPHLYAQLQSYSLMSEDHEPVYVVIKNRATGEIFEIVFPPDEDEWKEIERGISQLENVAKDPVFDYRLIECPNDPDSYAARYCPYRERELCSAYTNIPEVTEAEVVQALSEYDEGKALASQGRKIQDAAKGLIVAYIHKQGVKKVRIGNRTLTLTSYSRRSCDFDELLKQNPGLFDQVISESDYEKLTS